MSAEQINSIKVIVNNIPNNEEIKEKFLRRIDKGKLIIDENSDDHFVIWFAAYDPELRQVFIGYHKKTNYWLFNAGHINFGETPQKAVEREMKEEWGINVNLFGDIKPAFLTVGDATTKTGPPCKIHYDIWHFIPVKKELFRPKKENLEKEFIITGWYSFPEARKLFTYPSMFQAIEQIEKLSEIK